MYRDLSRYFTVVSNNGYIITSFAFSTAGFLLSIVYKNSTLILVNALALGLSVLASIEEYKNYKTVEIKCQNGFPRDVLIDPAYRFYARILAQKNNREEEFNSALAEIFKASDGWNFITPYP
ncbi:MAG: hypothetical protein QXM68_02110 [Candidatus Aenigmatarchaeota archaeon]|nr:hypothetical protein [Candidatus Aenigmarchaeota archaeon]